MAAPTPIWRGSVAMEEQTGSPNWNFGEKTVVTRTFKGPYTTLLSNAPPRGAWGTGQFQGLRVAEVNIVRERGSAGTLVYRMEGILRTGDEPTQELPPDEGGVTNDKQEFSLEEHPNYNDFPSWLRDAVLGAVQGHNDKDRGDSQNVIDAVDVLYPEAQALVNKLKRGQTHFVQYAAVYKWVVYSYVEPVLDKGGYPQTPFGPFSFPAGLAWLREGDTKNWTGTHWQLTRSWLSAFFVDSDIYPVPTVIP